MPGSDAGGPSSSNSSDTPSRSNTINDATAILPQAGMVPFGIFPFTVPLQMSHAAASLLPSPRFLAADGGKLPAVPGVNTVNPQNHAPTKLSFNMDPKKLQNTHEKKNYDHARKKRDEDIKATVHHNKFKCEFLQLEILTELAKKYDREAPGTIRVKQATSWDKDRATLCASYFFRYLFVVDELAW